LLFELEAVWFTPAMTHWRHDPAEISRAQYLSLCISYQRKFKHLI